MKRLALLFTLLSLSVFAEGRIFMWLRNHGAYEAVVRVSKEQEYYEFYGFTGVTNGLVTRYFPHEEITNVLWRVDYDYYSKHQNNSIGAERKAYSYFFYATEQIYPVPDPMSWTNNPATIAWQTNHFAEVCANDNGNQRYVYTSFTVLGTNVVDVTRPPITYSNDLPCRFGVPASVTVNLPYADILELLPLNYPETFIRVRAGFDGYLLFRLSGPDELNLTIKRLLPEKLPYEKKPRNIRVSRDDLLNGV